MHNNPYRKMNKIYLNQNSDIRNHFFPEELAQLPEGGGVTVPGGVPRTWRCGTGAHGQ